MAKIKKLTRKHCLPRWMRRLLGIKERRPRASDILANLDEMHEVPAKFPTLYFVCPCCGTKTPMEERKPRPDGYTIAQTIIDEVPTTDYQKRAVEFLKAVAPDYPEYAYKVTAVNLEAMYQSSPYAKLINEVAKRLDGRATPYSPVEMNINVVDEEEHSEIHQSYKS